MARMNWSKVGARNLMSRRGVESVRGDLPFGIPKPRGSSRRPPTKSEMRAQAAGLVDKFNGAVTLLPTAVELKCRCGHKASVRLPEARKDTDSGAVNAGLRNCGRRLPGRRSVATQADARRAEINRERRRRPVSIVALRLAELNRLLTDRHGGEVLADDDAGREDVMIVVHHLAGCVGDQSRKIAAWIALRAPWMAAEEAEGIVTAAIAKPRRWRADTLAKRLNLMEADRRRMRITTIGSVDCPKEQRARNRAESEATSGTAASAAKRHAAGATPRSNSLSNTKPWLVVGICRRTWERRRARAANSLPSIDAQYAVQRNCDRRAS